MSRKCDICENDTYCDENPRVFLCQPRPSDPSEMVCTLAGHSRCITTSELECTPDGGIHTANAWGEWIESPQARIAGILFLTL